MSRKISGIRVFADKLTIPDCTLDLLQKSLLLDSRVVAFEDGVYCRHLMLRSLTGVQLCRSTLRISSMMGSVIRQSASCAGPTALRAPLVRRNRSSSVAGMTRNPLGSAMSVTAVTNVLMI